MHNQRSRPPVITAVSDTVRSPSVFAQSAKLNVLMFAVCRFKSVPVLLKISNITRLHYNKRASAFYRCGLVHAR
jgi:hypothetical protein